MIERIKEYYKKHNINQKLIEHKVQKLSLNADIAKEFDYWISNKKYIKDNCVCVEGYTAEKIASLSKFMNGDGPFMLLIELRENKDVALKKINRGFKIL